MSMFRSLVVKDFITLIVEQCLMLSIPDSKEDLQNFDEVCSVKVRLRYAAA